MSLSSEQFKNIELMIKIKVITESGPFFNVIFLLVAAPQVVLFKFQRVIMMKVCEPFVFLSSVYLSDRQMDDRILTLLHN